MEGASTGQDLEQTAAEAPSGQPADLEAFGAAPGQRIGRYIVTRILGTGGMGVVYQAYDPDLDRMVAVKKLRARGNNGSKEARARLQREAQAMAKLQHPNVIAVHDVGIERGELFVAMELVEGETLRDWMLRPHHWRETVRVFVAAGRGLAAAHGQGMVHRDFKPANVLIGDSGRVRVLDFGLVCAPRTLSSPSVDPQAQLSADQQVLTAGGVAMGTPAYMALEQHTGKPTDERSDIFAYCVALFEALHGTRPFEQTTIAALVRAKHDLDIAAPRDKSVPNALAQLVERGLAPNPEDRPATMAELLVRLERELGRNRPVMVAVGAAGVLAIAGATAWAWRADPGAACADVGRSAHALWSEPTRRASLAAFVASGKPYARDTYDRIDVTLGEYLQDWASARKEVCEATLVRHQQPESVMRIRNACLDGRLEEVRTLVGLFEGIDGALLSRVTGVGGSLGALAHCRALDEDAERIRRPPDPSLRARGDSARTRLSRAKTLFAAGRYPDGQVIAREVARALDDGTDPAVLGEALYLLGSIEDRLGEPDAAEVTLHRALWASEAAGDTDVAASTWTRLAWVVGSRLSRWTEGLRHGRHAEALDHAVHGPDHNAPGILTTMGSIQFSAGHLSEALALHRRALRAGEVEWGSDSLRLTTALVNIGLTHYARDEAELAQPYFERALALQEENLGPSHPRVAKTVDGLGLAAHDLGEHAQARALFSRALALRIEAFGPDSAPVSLTLRHLGDIALCEDDLATARGHYERMREVDAASPKRAQRQHAFNRTRMGALLLREGDAPAAEVEFQRARALQEGIVPRGHLDRAFVLAGLGEAELAQGKTAAAITALERAAQLRNNDPDALSRADSAFALAKALHAAGQTERARSLAHSARAAFRRARDPQRDRSAEADAWLAERANTGSAADR